jgi:hypothetical protein
MFPDTSYGPDPLALLTRAFDDAWKDVQSALVVKPLAADGAARELKGNAQVGLGKVKDGAKGMDKALNK